MALGWIAKIGHVFLSLWDSQPMSWESPSGKRFASLLVQKQLIQAFSATMSSTFCHTATGHRLIAQRLDIILSIESTMSVELDDQRFSFFVYRHGRISVHHRKINKRIGFSCIGIAAKSSANKFEVCACVWVWRERPKKEEGPTLRKSREGKSWYYIWFHIKI